MNDISEIIKRDFASKTIVIVGDLVADQFLKGTIARVSREAPVFILRHDETETLAGGAANAATNVSSLGGNAKLVGIIGGDQTGTALLERLSAANVDCSGVVTATDLKTTTKVRVLAGQQYAARQQVIRIDYENPSELAETLVEQISEQLRRACETADAIILSDYNYGVANRTIAEIATEIAREKRIPLLVDSRFRLTDFRGATSATPNQDEVEQILGQNFTADGCKALCGELGYEALLVTRGNKGMILVERDKPPFYIDAVGSKEPVDVTGAGDTVIAAYALGLACGLGFEVSAAIANFAGGIVVMKKGTAAVDGDELIRAVSNQQLPSRKAQSL